MKALTLNRGENGKGIPFAHGTLHPDHDYAARFFRVHRFFATRKVEDVADWGAAPYPGPQLDPRNEQTVERGLVMNLQVRLLRAAGDARDLPAQSRLRTRHQPEGYQQAAQAKIKRSEIGPFNVTFATAFGVDCRDAALGGRAKRATGQEGSGPAPEAIKAGRHRPLNAFDGAPNAGDIADPRLQAVGYTGAVEVGIMGDLRQHLFVEQPRESAGWCSVPVAGETARQISAIVRTATGSSKECHFVKHGNQDDCPAQRARLPAHDPLLQECGALVFVAVCGAVDQQDRPGSAAPDESLETHAVPRDAAVMKSRRQGS